VPLYVHGNEVTVDALIDGKAANIARPEVKVFAQGIWSPGAYIDNRKLGSHPTHWDRVLRQLIHVARRLEPEYDTIASVATGGIVHASVLAWLLKRPHVIVKKDEKGHGLSGLIDGDTSILRDARVLLIEDMSSTFMSCLKAMKPLEEEGARVMHTLFISTWNLPDFQQNIVGHEVHALCTGEMILNRIVKRGNIDADHNQIMRRWLVNPEDRSWAYDGKWKLPQAA